MRSQVQVLAGPPPIPAGHSAAGREPGTPAASLGRAGAARPPWPARPLASPDPSTRAAGPTTTTHRGRPPSPGQQPRGRCGHPRAAAYSRAHSAAVSDGRSARRLACLVAQPVKRDRARTHLARARHRPPLTNATSAASPRPGLLGRPSSRSKTRQPTGTRPVPVVTVAAASTWSPLQPPEVGRDGRVRTDGGGQQPAGRRTGGRQTGGRRTAGRRMGRTPDGPDTGRAGHQMAGHRDGWTAGPGRRNRTGGHHMVDADR
jgi:hypothetical protein